MDINMLISKMTVEAGARAGSEQGHADAGRGIADVVIIDPNAVWTD